jgi:predicted porin
MNKKISAAVTSAALVLGASSAHAGVIIPAGEWTVDINGNVNAYVIHNDSDAVTTTNNVMVGAMANSVARGAEEKGMSINTGLLPSWLGVTATTRQNDLDVSWTISFQPGASSNNALSGGGGTENRQAFLTFGDKSWGTVKIGKDLGIFGSTAILSDMTLLGVGSQGIVGTQGGTTTTLGGIGTGYVYADWKGQVSYTTPNMNGFQATLGVVHPWHAFTLGGQVATGTNNTVTLVSSGSSGNKNYLGFEGQASYSFAAGKIWVGFAQQDVDNLTALTNTITAALSQATIFSAPSAVRSVDEEIVAVEAGINLNYGNAGITAYYYNGEGLGTTAFGLDGFDAQGEARDSDGGYIQGTYVIPTGTKIGVAYGVSNLDPTAYDNATGNPLVEENKRWTVGAYHPLTKHLNLVAEYNNIESKAMSAAQLPDMESDIMTVGAILFF